MLAEPLHQQRCRLCVLHAHGQKHQLASQFLFFHRGGRNAYILQADIAPMVLHMCSMAPMERIQTAMQSQIVCPPGAGFRSCAGGSARNTGFQRSQGLGGRELPEAMQCHLDSLTNHQGCERQSSQGVPSFVDTTCPQTMESFGIQPATLSCIAADATLQMSLIGPHGL